MTVKNLTISAGVLSAAAAVLLIVATPSSPTFADAIKSIQNAHVVSYDKTYTHTLQNGKSFITKSKVYERDDGSTRSEYEDSISIQGLPNGKYIRLLPKTKVAEVPTGPVCWATNDKKYELRPYMSRLQKTVQKPEKDLGEKELDGKKVKGFVAPGFDKESITVVWVDVNTNQPVQIEDIDDTKPNATPRVIYSKIEINPENADALFDVPEGYTIVDPIAERLKKMSDEEKIISALQACAGYSPERRFPPQFKDLNAELEKLAGGNADIKKHISTPFFKILNVDIAKIFQSLPKDDHAYLGDGKKLGQKDEIIFWYRKPAGGYRAIYGDLSTKDIKPEDLPKQ
jgi:hypothetical protein